MQSYPYYANEERRSRIFANIPFVKPGLNSHEVRKLLGEPDEINDTYSSQKHRPQKIGFSYVYVVQRLKSSGSVEAMQEKLARVHFNMDRFVVRVDLIGFTSRPRQPYPGNQAEPESNDTVDFDRD